MNVEPTIGLALLAGFVSFISPCVLPLVPAYIGYMGGHATTAASEGKRNQFSTFIHGVFFVLGFTLFFVGFGLLTAAASDFLTDLGIDIPTILTRLGGVAVVLFGLYVMKVLDPVFSYGLKLASTMRQNRTLALFFSLVVGTILLGYFYWVFENIVPAVMALLILIALFRKPLQTAENIGDFWYKAIQSLQSALISDTRKLQVRENAGGYLGSLSMGIVFSAGWTPCIGPIYGSVLTLASDSAASGGSLLPAAAMLTAYSLGLGIPFLVTALALNQMTGLMSGLKRNMRKVEYASGVLLIGIGILILSGSLEELSARFGNSGDLGDLSVRLEACSAGAAEGRIALGTWPGCIADGTPKLNDRIVFASVTDKTPTLSEVQSLGQETDSSAPGIAEQAETLAPTGGEPLFTPDPNFDPSAYDTGTEVGDLAPTFETVTPKGESVALEDLRGNIVLLNFWATWCGPCRVEMPEFQSVYDQLNDQGFTVLAVDFLESPEQVQGFLDEIGVNFPVGMDESGEINDMYRIAQYPTSYVLDGHGVIRARHAGLFTGDQLLEVINRISESDDS